MKVSQSTVLVLVAFLIMLPGCEWFRGDKKTKPPKVVVPVAAEPSGNGSEVLMTIDGNSKITANDFDTYMNEFLDAQPQYKQLINFIPDAKKNIFDGMVNEVVLSEWVRKQGINKKEAYQKDLDRIKKFGERSLAVKYFQEAYPVKVTESEIRKFYNDEKDNIPELVSSPGGVSAKGVTFEKEDDAKAFLDKVKDPKDFDNIAKEENLTIKDYGKVNKLSFDVSGAIRERLLAMKKFPSTELIKVNDKKYAVVFAQEKEEPKYVPFEQVKAGLENLLKQKKATDVLVKELENLKKSYNIIINEDFFEREKKAKEEATKKVMEAAQQTTPNKQRPATNASPSPIKGA